MDCRRVSLDVHVMVKVDSDEVRNILSLSR